MLRWALRYAAAGRPVFPVVPAGKMPLIPKTEGGRGVLDATTDEGQIREWWGRCPRANIGLALAGWLVVDIDPRNGGDATWARWCDEHGEPATLTQRTGGLGLHYVFQHPGVEVRATPAQGIDVKHGASQYILASPSLHPSGRRYEWIRKGQPQPMPPWLVELCERPKSEIRYSPSSHRSPIVGDMTTPDIMERAHRYASRHDAAISGSGGHQATWHLCLLLATRFPELGPDDLLAVLARWNESCQPPWSMADLGHKLADAMRVAGRVAA